MAAFSNCDSGRIADDRQAAAEGRITELERKLRDETNERRRAECQAHIQDQASQLTLDLIAKEPDIAGFFAGFTKKLVEETESHACGVWLLDEDQATCDLWLAHLHNTLFTPGQDGWDDIAIPRAALSEHLFSYRPGWGETILYTSQDPRLPDAVKQFNVAERVEAVAVAPLVLGAKTLGWIALSTHDASVCEQQWARALLAAIARQATLVLHQERLADQRRIEDRRSAVLEERNRLARDIHDTLAQGFGAILMQLQAAQREAGTALPDEVAASLDAAVNLARMHLVDARRSVTSLRPLAGGGRDITAGLKRLADTARLTTNVPIDVMLDELPTFDAGVEREILGIAQEALSNAARHARAQRITLQASAQRADGFRLLVTDDGRGIANDRRDTGFGMTSMQERANRIGASLTIVTAPRAGTQVVIGVGTALVRELRQMASAVAPPVRSSVLVVDDHALLRTGVANIINQEKDLFVVAQAANGVEAVAAFERHHPDVTLLDLRMPEMEGVEAVRQIRERDPQAKLIVLTTYDTDEDITRALRAGAKAYILKDIAAEALIACIHAVLAGKTYLAPAAAAKLAEGVARVQLTPRELSTLRLLADGQSNKEIAGTLGISERTVKTHLSHLFEKLGVTSRTEAVRVATRRGLVRLD